MYLSRIWLDTNNRAVIDALDNLRTFHVVLEESDPDCTRKLWRVDELGGRKCILVSSQDRLDLSRFASRFGDGRYEQADYDKLLDQVKTGTLWRFRLTANPVKCAIKAEDSAFRKVRQGHMTARWQEAWLAKRAESKGFVPGPAGFHVTGWKRASFIKPSGDLVQFISSNYEGMLTVVDENLFRDMLVNGFGREKAYGQGLMTVVPVRR